MLHSVNQLKLNQTWKLSAKKNYNTSIQAKLPPLWRVSNTISLLLQLNFPRKQLVWKWKKKKKSTHRYQTYKAKEVLVYSVMNSVDRCPVLLILFSRTQTMETLLDFHTFGSLRKISAEKKIIRVDRVTILRGFLLTLIEIITKSACETLFSTLAFDLELLVY